MKRTEVLERANKIICGDREQAYGKPEDNFKRIARLWSVYLDKQITPGEVAEMMVLLKLARIKSGNYKEDSYVDGCGYLAIAAELDQPDAVPAV